MRYRDAGVDLARSDAVKDTVLEHVTSTWTPAVRRLVGGFAGVMAWPDVTGSPSPDAPLLAATMDGVGTKLHVAIAADRVADAAADLVYHGANDLLVHGGRPLAFLDYIAQARLDSAIVAAAVQGLAHACREVGAVLLGGETAEMPDTYVEGVVDVAGCMIGWVRPDELLDGRRVRPGDAVLGLGSAGLHTNGFSLARAVLARSGLGLADALPGGSGTRVGDALLAPHRWYGKALLPELGGDRVRALAHVTGGGLAGNLVRVFPEGCRAVVDPGAWPQPPVFDWLMEAGGIDESEARRALNLGIGMVVVADPREARGLAADLESRGERAWAIGSIVEGTRGVDWK